MTPGFAIRHLYNVYSHTVCVHLTFIQTQEPSSLNCCYKYEFTQLPLMTLLAAVLTFPFLFQTVSLNVTLKKDQRAKPSV